MRRLYKSVCKIIDRNLSEEFIACIVEKAKHITLDVLFA